MLFEKYGQQRFVQQKTKDIYLNKGFLGSRSREINIAYTNNEFGEQKLNEIQKSYLKVAYWSIFKCDDEDSDVRQKARQFAYIFLLDLGLSPFTKCYDAKSLISAAVQSRNRKFFKELLQHDYILNNEMDFNRMVKNCGNSRDYHGNNLMHEICLLPDDHRNQYLQIVADSPIRIVLQINDEIVREKYIPIC